MTGVFNDVISMLKMVLHETFSVGKYKEYLHENKF